MFFSIDGGDGTGKSTQIDLFCQWLRQEGHEVVACRDPGSTPLGEAVRDLLLHRHDLAIDRRSEMLLYMAARAQMVEDTAARDLQRAAQLDPAQWRYGVMLARHYLKRCCAPGPSS